MRIPYSLFEEIFEKIILFQPQIVFFFSYQVQVEIHVITKIQSP